VCPTLDLIFIRRILFNFQPDEFSPDPISPALLGAINSEVSNWVLLMKKTIDTWVFVLNLESTNSLTKK
jgi:hypothetical protein